MSNTYTRRRHGSAVPMLRNRLKAKQKRRPTCVQCGAEIVAPETSPLCHGCVLAMSDAELEEFYARLFASADRRR